MNKHDLLRVIAPAACLVMMAFGSWCGYKRRFDILMLGVLIWVVFAAWMLWSK